MFLFEIRYGNTVSKKYNSKIKVKLLGGTVYKTPKAIFLKNCLWGFFIF